jgi:hypothetical protein
MSNYNYLTDEIIAKWEPFVNESADDMPALSKKKKLDMTLMFENSERELSQSKVEGYSLLGEAAPTNHTGAAISNFDPVLISLVRRAMPNLIAYDVCGVQPMTGPTGLVFGLRSRDGGQTGTESFYNEVNTGHTARGGANASATDVGYTAANTVGGQAGNVGTVPGAANNVGANTYNFAGAMLTQFAEGLGSNSTAIFPEMSFSIEKQLIQAKERALKAEYSIEIAQDLKAIHGLNIESELMNMLSGKILADINREVIRTILTTAVPGAQYGTTTAGVFDLDTDANGRWSVEKFKGLLFHLELEANAVAKGTRLGRGNVIICSSDVASALSMAGILDYAPALDKNGNLQIDDTGNTFAGVINGRMKVFIDPYTTGNYIVVGYKGQSAWEAGVYYCPYVPLQLLKAQNPDTMQPKLGFKTRYAISANIFSEGTNQGLGRLEQDTNQFYRRTLVANLF